MSDHLLAVYPEPSGARRTTEALSAMAADADAHIGDGQSLNAAFAAEQAEESGTMAALLTASMVRGIVRTAPLTALGGLVLALPLLWFRLSGWTPLSWMVLVAVSGFTAGGAFGFVIGGALGASRAIADAVPAEAVAVRVDRADVETVEALLVGDPLWIDIVDDGDRPVDVLATRRYGVEHWTRGHARADLLADLHHRSEHAAARQ